MNIALTNTAWSAPITRSGEDIHEVVMLTEALLLTSIVLDGENADGDEGSVLERGTGVYLCDYTLTSN